MGFQPFQFDPNRPARPEAIFREHVYVDKHDADHVLMPCSPVFRYVSSDSEVSIELKIKFRGTDNLCGQLSKLRFAS